MITTDTFAYIAMGALFGLTAGISPGPLLALVISETITHNKKEGIKVALAPLITDLPIIIIAYLIISRLNDADLLMGIISFCGAIFFVYLGYECLKTRGLDLDIYKEKPRSLVKGIVANVLNPHPYLYWVTVGIPIAIKAYQVSLTTLILHLGIFYLMLTGSKIVIALVTDRTREFISGKVYIWILRILGIALFIFAALFLIEGLKKLGVQLF